MDVEKTDRKQPSQANRNRKPEQELEPENQDELDDEQQEELVIPSASHSLQGFEPAQFHYPRCRICGYAAGPVFRVCPCPTHVHRHCITDEVFIHNMRRCGSCGFQYPLFSRKPTFREMLRDNKAKQETFAVWILGSLYMVSYVQLFLFAYHFSIWMIRALPMYFAVTNLIFVSVQSLVWFVPPVSFFYFSYSTYQTWKKNNTINEVLPYTGKCQHKTPKKVESVLNSPNESKQVTCDTKAKTTTIKPTKARSVMSTLSSALSFKPNSSKSLLHSTPMPVSSNIKNSV